MSIQKFLVYHFDGSFSAPMIIKKLELQTDLGNGNFGIITEFTTFDEAKKCIDQRKESCGYYAIFTFEDKKLTNIELIK